MLSASNQQIYWIIIYLKELEYLWKFEKKVEKHILQLVKKTFVGKTWQTSFEELKLYLFEAILGFPTSSNFSWMI